MNIKRERDNEREVAEVGIQRYLLWNSAGCITEFCNEILQGNSSEMEQRG